ncbi:MAG: hypothetical protein KDH18_25795, partial [Rhodoferax sp.]|nr:hypothetical protein [Rhodoferax sp.]
MTLPVGDHPGHDAAPGKVQRMGGLQETDGVESRCLERPQRAHQIVDGRGRRRLSPHRLLRAARHPLDRQLAGVDAGIRQCEADRLRRTGAAIAPQAGGFEHRDLGAPLHRQRPC